MKKIVLTLMAIILVSLLAGCTTATDRWTDDTFLSFLDANNIHAGDIDADTILVGGVDITTLTGIQIVWKGTLAGDPALPVNGWAYRNSTDGKTYIYYNAAWHEMNEDGAAGAPGAAGADGADGAAGSPGSVWYSGAGAPGVGLGINGDYYLNTTNGDVYAKAGGAWGLDSNIKGATGANGISLIDTNTDTTGTGYLKGDGAHISFDNSTFLTSVSGTNLDNVWNTTGLLKRTGAATYTTVSDNSADWDEAHGWGDHSTQGYLKTVTVTGAILDNVWGSNGILIRTGAATYSTTANNSANWDTAYGWGDHADEGYLTSAIVTEQGDVLYGSAVGTLSALPHGTAGQVLQSGGHAANPSWLTLGTMASQTATDYIAKSLYAEQGSIVYASAAATVAELLHGTAGQVLQSGGHAANPSWLTLGTMAAETATDYIAKSLADAKGDIFTATADNTPARLAVGTVNGQQLVVDSATATGLKWVEPFRMLMTTANQTINSGAGTYTDITNLTFSVVDGSTYAFKFYIVFRSAATTTGYKASVNCPTGTLDFFLTHQTIANSSTVGVATWLQRHSVTRDDMTTLTATITANVDLVVMIEGRYISTENGTFAARFANELAANTDITIRAGSWGYYFVNGAGAK